MVQVEMNNMYINIGANNGGEKLRTNKNSATSGKLWNKYMFRAFIFIFHVQVSPVG